MFMTHRSVFSVLRGVSVLPSPIALQQSDAQVLKSELAGFTGNEAGEHHWSDRGKRVDRRCRRRAVQSTYATNIFELRVLGQKFHGSQAAQHMGAPGRDPCLQQKHHLHFGT